MARKNEVVKIPYVEGTFQTEKYKKLKRDILSVSLTDIEIEGSIRGSKDVNTLNIYADFLMLTPDKMHLVTGVSTDSAIKLVYEGESFGLKYLLPHGKEEVDNNRMVYKFEDAIGRPKEVHFYANDTATDYTKFHGLSFGSHYANEATLQNVNGLQKARGRTLASSWRKIIYTQNPISPSNPFYTDIEKPLICTDLQIKEITEIQTRYSKQFKAITAKWNAKYEENRKKIILRYLHDHKKSEPKYLDLKETKELRALIAMEQVRCRQNREQDLYDQFKVTTNHFIYEQGGDNPNGIRNGLSFRYHHFTLVDNLKINEVAREQIISTYDKNSVLYKRDILGIRALTNGAIYDNITNDNYYFQSLPDNLMEQGWERILSIDYGVKNDFVVLDGYLDPKTHILFIDRELRFKGADESEQRPATNELYIKLLKDFIKEREKGRYSAILYDPSARAFANSMAVAGLYCQRAKNTVTKSRRVKKNDSENADKKLFKENAGIMLVKEGIGLAKIRINKTKCPDLVIEMEGYAFDEKKLKIGIEEPLKVRDHGCDALRYIVNTRIKTNTYWKTAKFSEVKIEDVKEKSDKIEQNDVESKRQGLCFGKF